MTRPRAMVLATCSAAVRCVVHPGSLPTLRTTRRCSRMGRACSCCCSESMKRVPQVCREAVRRRSNPFDVRVSATGQLGKTEGAHKEGEEGGNVKREHAVAEQRHALEEGDLASEQHDIGRQQQAAGDDNDKDDAELDLLVRAVEGEERCQREREDLHSDTELWMPPASARVDKKDRTWQRTVWACSTRDEPGQTISDINLGRHWCA